MKSTRLRIAANLVLFISLFAALVGCGLYSLFCLPSMLNLAFRWEYLAITGIGFVVCAIIALILAAASRNAARKEEEEARILEAALIAEAEAEALAAAEKEAAAEALCEEEKKNCKLPKIFCRAKACAKPTAAVAIEVGKIALPVVAACTVTAMVIKAKHRKQKERNRQAFYRWLG